jgi:biotin carboxylase
MHGYKQGFQPGGYLRNLRGKGLKEDSMSERILILGAGVMQGPALRIAKDMGLYTVAADADSNAPCARLADRFENVDLKDKDGIEALALSLKNNGGLAGIMTAGTDFSATVAWAAERLGLPGIPYEAALNASDKSRMRACFAKAGLPSPQFTVITEVPQVPPVPAPQYPLVVKPVDNMGGRGCRRVDNFSELAEAAAGALQFSRSRRAIAETFMEGPEFSVDAIVYHGEIIICGLADRHIFFPPYFIEMGHTMPTEFSPETQAALLDTFRAGVRALGIAGETCCGAAKGDIKLTPRGPMIGEIAARLSGGYMSGWTYPYASGAEPAKGAILAALGRKPEGLKPSKNHTSAERAFISIPGKVESLHNIEEARKMPFVKDLFLRTAPGGKTAFPENNVGKCGNIISAAPDRRSAAEAAEKAARRILIRLQAPNADTGAFLAVSPALPAGQTSAGQRFPPDAFTVPLYIRSALAELPDHYGAFKPGGGLSIIAFPAFQDSGLTDYAGRSVEESLDAVRELTGLPLPLITGEEASFSDNKRGVLGLPFWAALIRGGYQAAVYTLDSLTRN